MHLRLTEIQITATAVQNVNPKTVYDTLSCLVRYSLFVLIQRLDNMARLPPAYCTKIFLQRDYSDGTAVRFQTKFPQELEGKVVFYVLFFVLNYCMSL